MAVTSFDVGYTQSIGTSPFIVEALESAMAVESSTPMDLTDFGVNLAVTPTPGGVRMISRGSARRNYFVQQCHAHFSRKTSFANRSFVEINFCGGGDHMYVLDISKYNIT